MEKSNLDFRRKTIKRLVRTTRQVIATGGGIVKNPVNINHLKKTGHIVYLKASAKHIYNNIKMIPQGLY